MNCPGCGLVIDKPERHCPNCGTQLSNFDLTVQQRDQTQIRQEKDPLLLKLAYGVIRIVCSIIAIVVGIVILIGIIIGTIETILSITSLILLSVTISVGFQ